MTGSTAGSRQWAPLRRSAFVRHQRGAVAIEFGLLAVPFFMIVGAILETSLVFLSSQILETAVQDASRHIRTGQAAAEAFEPGDFRARICGHTWGLFGDCSGLFIKVAPIDNFQAAIIQAPVDPECEQDCTWTEDQDYDGGAASSYMLVQAYYRWPVLLDFPGLSSLADGTRLMGSAAIFRNEPF